MTTTLKFEIATDLKTIYRATFGPFPTKDAALKVMYLALRRSGRTMECRPGMERGAQPLRPAMGKPLPEVKRLNKKRNFSQIVYTNT
jgi:hypothetical protein